MAIDPELGFEQFFARAEPVLRVALVGAFGPQLGRDATATALAWAWQNWDRLAPMDNPVGYLYRVGRNDALKEIKIQQRHFLDPRRPGAEPIEFEPMLADFLSQLTEVQRVAVWMVHGLGYSHGEAAEVLQCAKPTVATHVRRALAKLRAAMEVELDV